jgi:hypothetical protein
MQEHISTSMHPTSMHPTSMHLICMQEHISTSMQRRADAVFDRVMHCKASAPTSLLFVRGCSCPQRSVTSTVMHSSHTQARAHPSTKCNLTAAAWFDTAGGRAAYLVLFFIPIFKLIFTILLRATGPISSHLSR